jgi:hypothetical protein
LLCCFLFVLLRTLCSLRSYLFAPVVFKQIVNPFWLLAHNFSVACESLPQQTLALVCSLQFVESGGRAQTLPLQWSAATIFIQVSIFSFGSVVWIVAETHPGHTLELLDQKARGLLVQIVLKRLSPEHAHNVFGEIPVRIETVLRSNFCC